MAKVKTWAYAMSNMSNETTTTTNEPTPEPEPEPKREKEQIEEVHTGTPETPECVFPRDFIFFVTFACSACAILPLKP